jgi:hypothetical protein
MKRLRWQAPERSACNVLKLLLQQCCRCNSAKVRIIF